MTINILLALRAYTIHPLVIIIRLIICTSIVAFRTFSFTKISLFRYIIILVILGGLIILFIYIASLAPNEPIPTKKLLIIITISIIATIIIKLLNTEVSYQNNKSIEISMLMNNIRLITIAASYLFITLVVVVHITKISRGPLRSKF